MDDEGRRRVTTEEGQQTLLHIRCRNELAHAIGELVEPRPTRADANGFRSLAKHFDRLSGGWESFQPAQNKSARETRAPSNLLIC